MRIDLQHREGSDGTASPSTPALTFALAPTSTPPTVPPRPPPPRAGGRPSPPSASTSTPSASPPVPDRSHPIARSPVGSCSPRARWGAGASEPCTAAPDRRRRPRYPPNAARRAGITAVASTDPEEGWSRSAGVRAHRPAGPSAWTPPTPPAGHWASGWDLGRAADDGWGRPGRAARSTAWLYSAPYGRAAPAVARGPPTWAGPDAHSPCTTGSPPRGLFLASASALTRTPWPTPPRPGAELAHAWPWARLRLDPAAVDVPGPAPDPRVVVLDGRGHAGPPVAGRVRLSPRPVLDASCASRPFIRKPGPARARAGRGGVDRPDSARRHAGGGLMIGLGTRRGVASERASRGGRW